jgi:hypothetical protein
LPYLEQIAQLMPFAAANIGLNNLQAVLGDGQAMALAEGIIELLSPDPQQDEFAALAMPLISALLCETAAVAHDGKPGAMAAVSRRAADRLVAALAHPSPAVFAAAAAQLGRLRGRARAFAALRGAAPALIAGLAAHRASEPAQAAGLAAALALARRPAGRRALLAAGLLPALAAARKWHGPSGRVLSLVEGLLDAVAPA